MPQLYRAGDNYTDFASSHTHWPVSFSPFLSPFPLLPSFVILPPSLFLSPTQSLPFPVLNMGQEMRNTWEIKRIAGGPVRGAAEAIEDLRAPKTTLVLERKCGEMRQWMCTLGALLNNQGRRFPYFDYAGQERLLGF